MKHGSTEASEHGEGPRTPNTQRQTVQYGMVWYGMYETYEMRWARWAQVERDGR